MLQVARELVTEEDAAEGMASVSVIVCACPWLVGDESSILVVDLVEEALEVEALHRPELPGEPV